MKPKAPDTPLVSIVTPSYNQGQFIEETILSIKNEDYPNIEHMLAERDLEDDTDGRHILLPIGR